MSEDKPMSKETIERALYAVLGGLFSAFDGWVNSKVDRLVEGLKPELKMHTEALEKNAEASTMLALRLGEYIEHQWHSMTG